MLSGWRSYLDSAEHPMTDLPNKIFVASTVEGMRETL